jgi:hypothetical protein
MLRLEPCAFLFRPPLVATVHSLTALGLLEAALAPPPQLEPNHAIHSVRTSVAKLGIKIRDNRLKHSAVAIWV